MKVINIMQKCITTVHEDTTLKDVVRYIFTLGISAVPVIRGKKLVGIVAQTDILKKLYPSIIELTEDYVHLRDFELMEKNLKNILDVSVGKFMNSKVASISPDAPIMNAQSRMLINEFSHLPVVDKKGNLLGIVSQGDIFRRLIRDEIPKLDKEKYADFIAHYYDRMVDWEKRFIHEFPAMIDLFTKIKANSIVDFGSWTGEYAIGLVKKKGYSMLGLDHNPIMIKLSEQKKNHLTPTLRKKISFLLTDFENLPKKVNKQYDAAMCMGNALPYFPVKPVKIFKLANSILKKKSFFIVQILNFDKILKSGRLLNFEILKSDFETNKESLFIEFFERKTKTTLMHHVILFDHDGKNWVFKGITSIEIQYFSKKDIEEALKTANFKNIQFSGEKEEYRGKFGKLLFKQGFNQEESDWLIAVAKK